jgi:hypothetical protein
MSTIIIGGGGGHAAIDRAVALGPKMTTEEMAKAARAEQQFVATLNKILDAVEKRG